MTLEALGRDPAKSKTADVAIINANILTCDAPMTRATAIAIQGGRISAIGKC